MLDIAKVPLAHLFRCTNEVDFNLESDADAKTKQYLRNRQQIVNKGIHSVRGRFQVNSDLNKFYRL